MIFKIIIFILAIVIIYTIFFKNKKDNNPNSEKQGIQNFLQCDKCGIFTNSEEITKVGQKNICNSCKKDI